MFKIAHSHVGFASMICTAACAQALGIEELRAPPDAPPPSSTRDASARDASTPDSFAPDGSVDCPPCNYELAATLRPDDPVAGDLFGFATAAFGHRVAVGAPGRAVNAGIVYIFERDATSWRQVARALSPFPADNAQFGFSIGLDEQFMVVGAPTDMRAGVDAGAAYVFERTADGPWVPRAALTPATATAGDAFGTSVAITSGHIIVGAPGDDESASDAGAVYVYQNVDGTWQLQTKIIEPSRTAKAQFGSAIGASDRTLVIGAPRKELPEASGIAYLFQRVAEAWQLTAELLPVGGSSSENHFGTSVAINASTVVIGAKNDQANGPASGSAHVFALNDNTEVIQASRVGSPQSTGGARFGYSVAAAADYIAIGAVENSTIAPSAGAVVPYHREPSGVWRESAHLGDVAGSFGDFLGNAVSIAEGTIFIGAPGKDGISAENVGSLEVFEYAEADQF